MSYIDPFPSSINSDSICYFFSHAYPPPPTLLGTLVYLSIPLYLNWVQFEGSRFLGCGPTSSSEIHVNKISFVERLTSFGNYICYYRRRCMWWVSRLPYFLTRARKLHGNTPSETYRRAQKLCKGCVMCMLISLCLCLFSCACLSIWGKTLWHH